MDEKTRSDLKDLIEKYNIHMKSDGSGITWSGFPPPDKMALAHIKTNSEGIIEILTEE